MVFSSFPLMLGNARRMIGFLGKVVVEGELLARELLTLHPLDAEKGQKFSKFCGRGGGLFSCSNKVGYSTSTSKSDMVFSTHGV